MLLKIVTTTVYFTVVQTIENIYKNILGLS